MTVKAKGIKNTVLPLIISAMCFCTMFLFADELKDAFVFGVRLSVCSVLPAVFPFMILADYMSVTLGKTESGRLAGFFSRALGTSRYGPSLLLIGLLCGFPVGARTASDAYLRGHISREECERLCAVASAPSPVFVISGVGLIRGSIAEGILLYAAVVCSALICTVILPRAGAFSQISEENKWQNFNITDSVKRAGNASLTVSTFIIFFSMVNMIVKKLILSPSFATLICCFLEIGNAACTLAESNFSGEISLALCGFSLGFSGLSVLLQSFAFIPADISKRRIVFAKLIQGTIAFIICFGAATIT